MLVETNQRVRVNWPRSPGCRCTCSIKFSSGQVARQSPMNLQAHQLLVDSDEWIIDGFGCIKTVWQRLDAADTLIHVDLPLATHALWVTKRLVKGLFVNPEGWPERSPIFRSTISSYRVLWPCHSHLTPKYRAYVSVASKQKQIFQLRSKRELKLLPETIKNRFENSQLLHERT